MPSKIPIHIVHTKQPQERAIRAACAVLEQGGVVLFPTETGYCLGASPKSPTAFQRFLSLRQAHPKQKPFSLLCSDIECISQYSILDTSAYRILKRAGAGPYTFLLPANRYTPNFRQAPHRPNVGIRISTHPVASSLATQFAFPIVVTSITDADELEMSHYFDDSGALLTTAWWAYADSILENLGPFSCDFVLAVEEATPIHVSTIIDLSSWPAQIIRDGGWDISHLGL